MDETKKLYNIKEAAAYLGISANTVSRAIRRGNISVVELNGRPYISKQVLDKKLSGDTITNRS